MRVKIIGAGSVGNHLAYASRRMGWEVVVVDSDPRALVRMEQEVYPRRYGAWDGAIKLYPSDQAPWGGFDIICIGTPPNVRMKLALQALEEEPALLHLEKPLCPPSLEGVREFRDALLRHPKVIVTVGYDHAVAESVQAVVANLEAGRLGEVQTLDVEFREHWRGIFAAHPWLRGPQDTYLGYWERGGGASGEHSHALHLWQHLGHVVGWGRVRAVQAMMDMREENGAHYDRLAAFSLWSERGGVGRVIQDVITYPTRKWARLQGTRGFLEWICNGATEGDLIRYQCGDDPIEQSVFPKTRPDEFYREMVHYERMLRGEIDPSGSPLALARGLETACVLAAAHESRRTGRRIFVSYDL